MSKNILLFCHVLLLHRLMFFVTIFITLDLEWKKGVSMKHFFPFLVITLMLCALLHSSSILSVSAQQNNSFASAKSLSLDRSVSISLPANASEYYYFTSLQSTDHIGQKYQITLSEADLLSVSAYDDQGSPVNLKQTSITKSYCTGYIDHISNNTRFFLVLYNQTEQNISFHLSVKSFHSATAAPKNDNNIKKAATAKPDKKTSSDSKKITTKKQRNTSASKDKHTQIPKATSRQNSGTKSATPKTQNKSRYSSNSKTEGTQTSKNNSKDSSISKGTTSVPRTTPAINKYPADSKTTLPEYTPNNQITTQPTPEYYSDYPMNHSRSNSILSTHFFRMSAGYSISAFELLPIDSANSEITLETMTPDNLSLQNNIIYAKRPGLAIIKIYSDNDITSCTIYIQETQEGGN